MADNSKIEWTDATWNPITGCSVTSPGCTNCYAMRLAGTRLRHHPSRKGLTEMSKAGPVWTGEVRLNEGWLDQPLRWEKPRRIFVCAHGDLFHENVPEAWVDKVFAVMEKAPQHTFQVLTKRADRMVDYFTWCPYDPPPPNCWLGVSVEDQERANERIPHLLNTPAAVRFISYEPALGPLDLTNITVATPTGPEQWNCLDRVEAADAEPGVPNTVIDWVIAGGESGRNARPADPDWFRSLRDQCRNANVPFFMKQMARRAPIPDDLMIREFPG